MLILFSPRGIAKHPHTHNKKPMPLNKHEHLLVTIMSVLLKLAKFWDTQ